MDRGDQAEEDLHVLLNLLRERTALARKGGAWWLYANGSTRWRVGRL